MATAKAATGKIGTPTRTMNPNRLNGVLRARRLVAASKSEWREERGQRRRNQDLVQPQTAGQQLLEEIQSIVEDGAPASSL